MIKRFEVAFGGIARAADHDSAIARDMLLMTTQQWSASLDRTAPRPVEVEIVVRVHDQRRQRRDRIPGIAVRRHRALVTMLVVFAAATGAVCAAVLVRGTAHAKRSVDPRARAPGAAGVAEADEHSLRCLSITIAPDDPAYARADFNRVVPCGRYAGYATAIFHRVRGVWRPVLDSLHYSCPAADVGPAIQAELGVCP